jgi:TolB-like protein/Tfp pilus assembly protein PilF
VNRLREALGDSAATPRYIQTAPRRGYRFIAKVELETPNPGPSAETLLGSDPSFQITSIAVNPLRNTSGDASQDHFAEVVTETLMGELAGIHQLKVFPGFAIPKTGSAGEPGLDILVEGSVIRLGNRMRIAVQVLQLPARVQIWSQKFDRSLGHILAVLKEVAAAIAAQIRADLNPQEQVQLNSALIIEPEAYDWYLRGRFYAQHQNKADNETAMFAFERAIAIDPTFALAYAELAQTYVWKLFLFAPHERQWQEKAFIAVEKALSLEPHLAVAYLARGRLLWTPANHFPHIRAIRDYRRAVALNPNLDEARNQLALIYCHIGYFEDALRESQEAALTNPNNNLAIYRTAQTFAFQGKYEQALAVLRTIPREVNPSLIGYQTAWVLFNLGKRGEASAMINQLLRAYPEDDGALFVSMQAVFATSAGEEAVAETKIQEAISKGSGFGHFHHSAYHIAIAFALINKPEQAMKWLDFAATDGFPCYPLFETDINLLNLRADPHFVDFMAKLRQQWLGYGENF